MADKPVLWMRHESRSGEGRAPITPGDVTTLVEAGFGIVVEDSHSRVFETADYADAGARIAPADTWADAPDGAIVIGLKELPTGETPLRDHIYFAHAYKGQEGADALLRRFVAGGGTLFDLEYLVDAEGRRLAAFGYWAGYVGAALAVLEQRNDLPRPLSAMTRTELDARLEAGSDSAAGVRALVVGAQGRSGRGACDALIVASIEPTRWDVAETENLDHAALLDHDILVNTVMVTTPVPPFVRPEDLEAPDRRLSVISDVTCDVTSECNVLPIYSEVTTWKQPVSVLCAGSRPVRLIAIDNLPTMLPAEASRTYSAELLPVLLQLPDGDVWQRARARFAEHLPAPVR